MPECQEFKIGIDVRLFQQSAKQLVHFDGAENIEYDGDNGELERRRRNVTSLGITKSESLTLAFSYHYYNNIQYVPDAFEVGELVYTQLKDLLHDVVEDEHTEDHLAAEDEEVPVGDVANQSNRSDLVGRDRSTRRWELNHQPERRR